MAVITTATNTDEVIQSLDTIIDHSKDQQSPLGYFAALYQLVTIKVKEGIADNFFEDGERMEKLDVIFANRYLAAYAAYEQSQAVTLSWEKAFQLSTKYWPIVLQHLLIGMNAHINLDLGIAASEVMKGKDIEHLKGDFDKINEVLSSLVHKVQKDLAEIWPQFALILKLTGKVDDLITDFSMQLARDGAWKFATELHALDQSAMKDFIIKRDKSVAQKARIITHPGWFASTLFKLVRIGEKGTVAHKIDCMQN